MMDEYSVESLVTERLRELRAEAAHAALLAQATGDRRSARAVIGQWLIRLGTTLSARTTSPVAGAHLTRAHLMRSRGGACSR